jgi:hypothetical protein
MGKNTKKNRRWHPRDLIFSNGMAFHDLDGLTIDEEQRFGVNQKE